MVHEVNLTTVLSEFARTLVTEFPIQGILDHLVERIVEVLPVSAAGVTLISPGQAPRYIAASDASALRFERLQTLIGEGPCLSAFAAGEAISVPDLSADDQFPNFAPAALASGLAAVFTFPLRHGEGQLGALDLYRSTPGDLGPDEMYAAQTLADVAAAYLLNAQAREDARATTEHFHHSAQHDALTGLPNRLLLQTRLEHAAQRAKRTNANAAVLFADLDRFKQVNDMHGHQVGDELLVAVAQRLSALVRPGDTLARVSGDEFVFLCEDLTSPSDVEVLARRIDRAFASPFALSTTELAITASVGIAFSGPGEEVSNDLVARADTAMYQAKRKGGAGHQDIDLREALRTNDRNSLERDLRRAFAAGDLDVAYQPVVRTADGVVIGVEALIRWSHPERGPIPARLIVAAAEQSGLIVHVGEWVLERACRDRGDWLREHPDLPLDMAVNVSARQLATPGFSTAVSSLLDATAMDRNALVLEMTENIFVEDSVLATTVLADLRDLGIRLALDDFGTGYSSLSYLRRLPVHIVKIDQSFIADIGHDPTGEAIVAAVTHLAHVLDLEVTAEGVETGAQRDAVRSIGCELSQGYFFSRPVPAAEISARLRARPSGPIQLPQPEDAVATA